MPLNRFLSRLIWWCVAPLALLAAYLAVDYVRHEHEEHDLEAQRLAAALATTIDHDLDTRIAALQILATSPLGDDATRWPDLYQLAQGYRQSFGTDVILASVDRRVHFTTRAPLGTPLPELPRPQGHSGMQAAVETAKPEVSDIFRDPFGGNELLVAVSVPAVRDGKVALVIATAIPLRDFQKHLDKLGLHHGWSAALLDATGASIARSPVNAEPTGSNSASAQRFTARTTAAPWSVALDIPLAVYLAPLAKAAATLAIAVLGGTLAGVLGGMFAARRLGNALRSLAETPARGVPAPDIAEIAAVRRLLDASLENRDRAEAALLKSHGELQRLFAQADSVQENERQRIALELHDDLQQTLAAISINVAALGERAGSDAASQAIVADIDDLAASAIASTRRIVSDLRPQILEDLGLVPALEVLAQQFSARNGIDCQFEAQEEAGARLLACPALATSLYRVAQEALNNVAKHSRARRVWMRLSSVAPNRVMLSIGDDGTGMNSDAAHKTGKFGIPGMHERVRILDGVLRIRSEPGEGTTVEVLVPVPEVEGRVGLSGA